MKMMTMTMAMKMVMMMVMMMKVIMMMLMMMKMMMIMMMIMMIIMVGDLFVVMCGHRGNVLKIYSTPQAPLMKVRPSSFSLQFWQLLG